SHTSPSIYVEFPLAPASASELGRRIPPLAGKNVSVLIWTTTPWTIPSNLAIAFHPEFDYAAYDVDGTAVIVAEALASSGAAVTGKTFGAAIARMKGEGLAQIRFQHQVCAAADVGAFGRPGTAVGGARSVPRC